MHKADIVFNLALVAHCNPAMAQQPAIQAFDLPSPLVAPQRPTILCFRSGAITAMRSNHLDATLSQCSIQSVRVIGLVANQALGFIRHKTGVKRGLNKLGFMRRSTRYVNGDRKASAVCNCHDLAPFTPLGLTDGSAPFLAGTNVPSIKHSDRSIWPRAYKSSAKVFRIWTNTPAFIQAWKYRWQVELDGYRLGMSAQAAPVRITHKMPFITSRGLQRGRPLPSARRGGTGMSGSIRRHCASVKSIGSHLSVR
jgi:hypothetical protein